MEMTYVALRPLRIRGERRETGDLVPEARDWHNLNAYISQGRITPVPRASVDADSLSEAEEAYEAVLASRREGGAASEEETSGASSDEAPASSPQTEEGVETTTQEVPPEEEETAGEADPSQVDAGSPVVYDSLTVAQVKEQVESGDLNPDDALEQELNREDGGRKGVLEFLEGLEDDEE